MVLVGHCTRNDCAAAGNAAAQNTNKKMQVISNFLLVMRPPSPPKAAIILPGCGKILLDRAHAAAMFKKLNLHWCPNL
jgi:hypothetical protein